MIATTVTIAGTTFTPQADCENCRGDGVFETDEHGRPTSPCTFCLADAIRRGELDGVADDVKYRGGEPQVTRCPYCGRKNLVSAAEWFAHSLDPQDLHNTGVLDERQCLDCARSFWV